MRNHILQVIDSLSSDPLLISSTMKPIFATCLFLLANLLSGCAVVAVADAAVTVVATGVKVTAKAVGAVADAVIPDGK
jgi:hypothetical protein